MASKETGQSGHAVPFRETELKICELCGWLNLESNAECFVCGWSGRFERDQEIIRAAIELASRRYGTLEIQHFTDLTTYHEPVPPTARERFVLWFRRLWSWRRR